MNMRAYASERGLWRDDLFFGLPRVPLLSLEKDVIEIFFILFFIQAEKGLGGAYGRSLPATVTEVWAAIDSLDVASHH